VPIASSETENANTSRLSELLSLTREFRTGHRRRQSTYELHGLQLPMRDWWQLLRWTPEQLRQHLQGANTTAAEPLPEKVSALQVAG
jgi:hypothetical protein